MNWYELRLRPGADPHEVYEVNVPHAWGAFHHFWDEPWHKDAYVVRIQADDDKRFRDLPCVESCVEWDSSEDEELYGPIWPHASAFFQVSSGLSQQSDFVARKLVHCFLNARGMSQRDEARFFARMLWDRLTIKLRWRLYLRRRWERARRAAA